MSDADGNREKLTSLQRVEERLTETEYFAQQMWVAPGSTTLGYNLNAFLSSARSVTFLLQKEFARVEGFDAWWADDRNKLGADVAARFFLKLRNFSQKEGPISIVGALDNTGRLRFMFAGTAEPVPPSLLYRDVADCCLEHLAKLARTLLRFAETFPYHACPANALTRGGVSALNLDLKTAGAILGFPAVVMAACPEGSIDDWTRVLRQYVDPVDFEQIVRIGTYEPAAPMSGRNDLSMRLGLAMVKQIEQRRGSCSRSDPSCNGKPIPSKRSETTLKGQNL